MIFDKGSANSSRHWRRLSRRMALISLEYAPCFQRARRLRSRPKITLEIHSVPEGAELLLNDVLTSTLD